ncbi:MAG: alcohol dehydrogenase catalytic domain-containing protein [Gemmatimonadales bacterium]|nr:alcohol dehydrogenase catalytic domain-containing protein [Gemmatimonadota bacterium]MCL4213160.1 alcohol dehydrogenase catalytic domain-containing protein [Gemmatimonadales bacterium]
MTAPAKGGGPETSIVIRAFNEERWLPDVFAALARQTYRDFEVILVDSGSLDRTREIAEANGARIVRLRSEDFTFGHSLNVGIEESRGAFIAILSAHAIPADERWLELLVAPLREHAPAMVYGGQRGHAVSKYSECRDFERVFPDEPTVWTDDDPFANNANSAIKRELWLEHPFDEGLPGLEDIEWAKYWTELERIIVYEPRAAIIHVHTESWAQVRRRYYREGMAARWVGKRILRHLPMEFSREARWLLADLWHALREGRLLALASEIARFRYEKTLGSIKGIVDSRGLDSPGRRAALYYEQSFAAVVVRAPHRAQVEYREVPILKPGEVLIRVAYVGICGTDLEILEGTLGYYKSGMASYPIVPGHESSGTIVEVGPRVTHLAKGDRVVVECIQGCGECAACASDTAIRCEARKEVGVLNQDGAYAEYMVARSRYVHRVPDDLPLVRAALAEPLAVVLKALRRLGAANGDGRPRSVTVLGAGTIGVLAARVLALRGHRVTVTDREPRRLEALGAEFTTSTSLASLGTSEWIVEATGNQQLLSQVMRESSTGSAILLLGFPYGREPFSFESVVAFDRSVIGSVGSSSRDFADALELMPALDLRHFVGQSLPLAEYERAWELVRSRRHLKVMLRVDQTLAEA